jgi:hypothetical protein
MKLLSARRRIELTFGRLKERFVFCKKNTFWNDLDWTRTAIEACCRLHFFFGISFGAVAGGAGERGG